MGRSTTMDHTSDWQPDTEDADASQRDPSPWHGQHGTTLAPVRLAVLRLRHGWRLQSMVGLGMLVIVTLICMVPLYSTLIADAQIRHTLASAPPSQINVATFTRQPGLDPVMLHDISAQVETVRQRELGAFAPNDTVSLRTSKSFPFVALNGQDIATARPDLQGRSAQLDAYDYQQALPHMQLLAGRLPRDVPDGEPLEVLATPKLGVHVGDLIAFAPLITATQQPKVRVVGIWFPKQNITDPFWNGVNFDPLYILDPPPPYPLLFTTTGLLGFFAGMLHNSTTEITIVYLSFTQPAAFDASNLQAFYDHLVRYRVEIRRYFDSTVGTSLDTLLRQLLLQRAVTALPLTSVVALIIGLVLLFVVIMAATQIERQRGELATLTSRGASRTQLLASFMLQSVLLALLLAPVGVLLAYTLARLLSRVFIPSATVTVAQVNRAMPLQTALELALAGVLLSSLAVLFAAWQATRIDMLAFRLAQGRGGRAPFWQRFYLDYALIAVCIVGYLELSQFGSLNVRTQLAQLGLAGSQSGPEQGTLDPLQLLTPVLLLLAGGLLVLRLFPLAARLGAWLAVRARGAAGMLAFAHMARLTAQFSRLALLLTFAVALGLFALGFDTSIQVNTDQRAAYETGGDVRVALNEIASASAFSTTLGANYAHLPGVTDVAPIYRTAANVVTGGLSQNVDMLGIDPASFGRVAYWQADYANQPLAQLLATMRAHTVGTTAAGQNQHPIWVLIDDRASATFHLTPGSRFNATPVEGLRTPIYFVVGAVVHQFPTMHTSQNSGFAIVNQQDLVAALQQISGASVFGPTEYWLRTTGDSNTTRQREQLLHANANLYAATITDRRALATSYRGDPLNAGMSGLLLVGATMAALLAVLGGLVQSSVSASQRVTLFAILRTLGMTRRQIRALLLSEQTAVYLVSALAGSVLGVVLATATLPFLQLSGPLQDPTTLGAPHYVLTFDGTHIAVFYATLIFTFVVALVTGSWVALRAGIGKVLRIGED